MEYAELVKFFRQLCGEYYPTETDNAKRFVLDAGELDVPNFVELEHETVFPQMQITPFVSTKEDFVGEQWTKAQGDQNLLQNPDIEYVVTDTSTHGKTSRFQIDILAMSDLDIYEIIKYLQTRYWKFVNAELAEFQDSENFEEIIETINGTPTPTGAYSSSEYNNSILNLARVEEIVDDERQVLTEVDVSDDVTDTEGSWFLDDDTLYIHPIADIDNIVFIEIIYGLVFHDGYCTKEKGLKSIGIITSTKGWDTDPDVSRWTMMLELHFRQLEDKTVGRSFAEVEVDAEED